MSVPSSADKSKIFAAAGHLLPLSLHWDLSRSDPAQHSVHPAGGGRCLAQIGKSEERVVCVCVWGGDIIRMPLDSAGQSECWKDVA